MKNTIKIVVLLQIVVITVVSTIGYLGYTSLNTTKNIQTQMQTELSFIHTEFKKAIDAQQAAQPLAIGAPAPEFLLKNSEGVEVSLASMNTTKKILVFSSPDCHYCTEYYPELDKFTKANSDVAVVVIQAASTPERNKELITDNEYTFKVLAGDETVALSYRIQGTPTTIILDKDNTVLSSGYPTKSKELQRLIEDVKG